MTGMEQEEEEDADDADNAENAHVDDAFAVTAAADDDAGNDKEDSKDHQKKMDHNGND